MNFRTPPVAIYTVGYLKRDEANERVNQIKVEIGTMESSGLCEGHFVVTRS